MPNHKYQTARIKVSEFSMMYSIFYLVTDTGSVFIAIPNNIEITCGTEAAVFPCEHKFGSDVHPLWIINNKAYKLSQLPRDHFYDGKALSVKNPKLKQNNTSYQCMIEHSALQNAENTCFYRSSTGYLWITCEGMSLNHHNTV